MNIAKEELDRMAIELASDQKTLDEENTKQEAGLKDLIAKRDAKRLAGTSEGDNESLPQNQMFQIIVFAQKKQLKAVRDQIFIEKNEATLIEKMSTAAKRK